MNIPSYAKIQLAFLKGTQSVGIFRVCFKGFHIQNPFGQRLQIIYTATRSLCHKINIASIVHWGDNFPCFSMKHIIYYLMTR